MKRTIAIFTLIFLVAALAGQQQERPANLSGKPQAEIAGIPCQMEELTSPQFAEAVELSGGVCISSRSG